MKAGFLLPTKWKQARNNHRRHIPAEMVEEILLNLPLKSLLRFSSVSKSWNSMIFGLSFIKRYRGRAALPGRERIVINPSYSNYIHNAFSCPLSSISSDQPIEDVAADLICPFQGHPYLIASCDELWCVEVENSMFLWNPSMRTYKKLPDPSLPPFTYISHFIYGLGYDSVGDDYKILKLPYIARHIYPEVELYSLRNDSWRKIQPFPGTPIQKGVFASGALHWMVILDDNPESSPVIVSFDLSTEKYGEVAQPEYSPARSYVDHVELTALRGMLCLCLNYYWITTFVLWVKEDYVVGKSWAKRFELNYYNWIPHFAPNGTLFFWKNGGILLQVFNTYNTPEIFIYIGLKTMLVKIVGSNRGNKFSNGFVYVESLISPAIWPTIAAPVCNNKA